MEQDRNLLFGVLAVQLKRITPIQLAEAGASWAANPSHPLGERLVASGVLSEGDRRMVEQMVDAAMAAHDGDAGATLASLGGEKEVYETLEGTVVPTKWGWESSRAPSILSGDGADPEEAVRVWEVPGRYRQRREHGRGGMGRVLLVRDESLGRDIVLKHEKGGQVLNYRVTAIGVFRSNNPSAPTLQFKT